MRNYLAVMMALLVMVSCSDKDKEDSIGGGHKNNTYFRLHVNGKKMELETIHYARSGKNVHLATWGENGFPNLNVTLTTSTEDDFRGNYAYDYDLSAGTAIVLYGIGEANGYESHWWDCPPDAPLLMPSPGSINIENIERTGNEEFITGSFTVQQYQPQGDCPYAEVKTIPITAEFRLQRAR